MKIRDLFKIVPEVDEDLDKIKADKLEHYAERTPREFLQLDSFDVPTEVIGEAGIDQWGHENWDTTTWELMYGATVRVLVNLDADPFVVSAFLAGWAETIAHDAINAGRETKDDND